MHLLKPKSLDILKSLFVIIFLYTLVVLIWPFFWGNYYSPTLPPTNPGIIYNKSAFPSQKSIFRAVVLGDSTALGQGTDSVKKSFGYQYLLTRPDLKDQNWSFENKAISGVKIAEVLERQLDFEPVELVMVSVGANDLTGNTKSSDFKSSVDKLAYKLQSKAKQVIWLNIPDFVTSPILLPPLNYILSEREHELNEIINNAATKSGYQIVDVYNKAREPFANYPEKNFGVDKYHPSAAGYAVWVEVINQTLKK